MKRLRDLLWSNSDTSQKLEILREKMKHLTAREADVLAEIENAEIHPGKRRRAEVVHWLTNVEVKKGEVQCIENECHQMISPNSQFVGQIERVTKDVLELVQQGEFRHGLVLDDHKSIALPFPVTGLVGEMFENIETILGWLANPGPFLIGVHGMGGVGKTTLLKYIHNYLLSNSDIAAHVQWVTVSQDCSLHKLQQKILCAVTGGKDFDEADEERRAAVLHNILAKMGKIVLILDDLWEPYMFDEVGIPLRENSCKIIHSTRSLDVCRTIGCEQFIVKVKPLSINEACKLFVDKLQNYEALATEVKQIATLVAKECGCLPLAIITVAVSMRGISDELEWENAFDKLKNLSQRQHNEETKLFSRLKFSYNQLNDEMMQRCFLSCVLYPEDYDIERKELIDLWIAERLLNGIGSRKEQVNKGHTVLNKLENSCLLESSIGWFGKKCVKMHDLIRDMGIIITRSHPRYMVKPGLMLEEVPEGEQYWTEDLVKVSLRDNEIMKVQFDKSPMCPKLAVLMLCHNPLKGIPDSFFIHMRALTVLDLSYTQIESLPDSICDLENLRALLVQCCEELIYVPSLSKLTKLTVLDLSYARKIKDAPRGMENLKCLKRVICLWNLSDLTYFHRLGEYKQFSELSCYEFWLHGGLNAHPYGVEPESVKTDTCWDFEKRVIITEAEFGEEVSTPLLPSTIQFLAIMNCDTKGRASTLGDILPSLSNAKELKSLKISTIRGLGYLSSDTQEVSSIFPQLDTLECFNLFQLIDLKGLIKFGGGGETVSLALSPRPTGTFTHLKKLAIQECHKLKVVFPLKLLQQKPCFPSLEEIQVIICEQVEEIFESGAGNSSSCQAVNDYAHSMNPIVALPKLRSLFMYALPKLRSIYKGLLCTPLNSVIGLDGTPKFGRTYRGPCLFWDDSLFTLPAMCTNNSDLWELLYRDFPEDARVLSSGMKRRMLTGDDPLLSSWIKWLHGVQEAGDDTDGNGCDNNGNKDY